MIATPEFRRSRYPERGSWVREAPADVFMRWMQRDDILAARRSEQAAALGLAVLTVDGSLSIAETAALAGPHFALDGRGPREEAS